MARRYVILSVLNLLLDAPLTAREVAEVCGFQYSHAYSLIRGLMSAGLVEYAGYDNDKPKTGRVAYRFRAHRKLLPR